MGSRERAIDVGAARGRAATDQVLRELRSGRLDRNLSGEAVAAAVGLSGAHYSRLERGLVRGITIEQMSALLAAVGLELAVRVYPAGEPIRDAAHVALIGRFRKVLHRSLRAITEVPFPAAGDKRAWDVVVAGVSWRHAYEAETRPRDLQALERRIALKARDGGVESVSLLLLDSRHNRDFVRAHGDSLRQRFPVPGRRALELLRAGADPGAGSVILI
ncbi:MAG TPA: helix-turn-helix transcriptional regulator [Candidatus Limnocylindrales bacterium]|nr:helix-turn-helix transcriptional regulator [Candidatus Limnocylindrales bacterium]